MSDDINPSYYTGMFGTLETRHFIDEITKHLPGDEAYKVANIIKYLVRYRKKGAPMLDIRKAENYMIFLVATVQEREKDEG